MTQPMTQPTVMEAGARRPVERRPVRTPPADIFETGDRLALPGAAPEAIEVTLEGRTLRIRGSGRAASPEGYRLAYAEYDEGEFERAFTLSEEIDRGRIKARCADGMLTLEFPKAKPAKTRRIEVKRA